MTKGKAFVLCIAAVMFIFISMYVIGIVKTDLEIVPVGASLTAIGTLAGLYIAGSVTNNGVKGKCWNQNMYDSENQKPADNAVSDFQYAGRKPGGTGDEVCF